MSTRPSADCPSRRNRDSVDECCRSGPSSASGSKKTVTASSKVTPCFAALASAFPLEHVFSIYGMWRHAGDDGAGRPSPVPRTRPKTRKKTPKRVLALADLEHAKAAVLSSLTSRSGQPTYDHAIREFVGWCCSEPRRAFNRTVVLRYRIYLEQRQYAPATINMRLAAVRRVAYEAADVGLLSPELAAGFAA